MMLRPMQLKITRLSRDVPLPAYATAGAAAFDLAAAADVEVPPHGIALVPTGLVVEVPPGHFLAILARSSTPLKRGLMVANGVGVVDADYCGPADEVKVQVINVTTSPVHVAAGDRIAQGMVLAAPRLELVEQPLADRASRGGFGSTGT
jgi:dUTP pyrophosphatase